MITALPNKHSLKGSTSGLAQHGGVQSGNAFGVVAVRRHVEVAHEREHLGVLALPIDSASKVVA